MKNSGTVHKPNVLLCTFLNYKTAFAVGCCKDHK